VTAPLVVKLGGELLETPERLAPLAAALVRLAARTPLVVVHGAGREIDAALARAGLVKHQVDGLRITDEATLDIVVSVMGGLVNTRLVAAVGAAGGRAVGLTGADAGLLPVEPAPPHRTTDGRLVDLGRVGAPIGRGRPALLDDLLAAGVMPIVASLGVAGDGRLFNVNADTAAADLAGRLDARALVLAGTTPGVLDGRGQPIARLTAAETAALIADGHATAGMIAKLRAGLDAVARGVATVIIADGRTPAALASVLDGTAGPGRTILIGQAGAAAAAGETETRHVGR